MADADTGTISTEGIEGHAKRPSVLVVLVAKDGAPWLRSCLIALSRQRYPRIGILAVDNASTDGSADLLEASLGRERVIRMDENRGFTGAAAEALRSPAAAAADYILLLHDDTALAPDAVERMVDAALRIEGVGVVGPKVLDLDRPDVLREVGQSVDRFGYAYSPLEEGEIDQGQYDEVREVLAVSSCAMLVAAPAIAKVGLPDERLVSQYGDLDFCWRVRIAGFRVLVVPQAAAYHRGAGISGDRAGQGVDARRRYQRERAALAAVLRNYGRFSLAWVLPLWIAQGVARAILLLLRRQLEDAYQMVAAIGWNVGHLPGTVARRIKTQAARRVRDHRIHAFMAPAGVRVRRWTNEAQAMLRPEAEEGLAAPSLRRQVARFAAAHPVFVAWVLAIVVGFFAFRGLWGTPVLQGGAAALFPSTAGAFFHELVSGVRDTGLGGAQAASPALALLGAGSAITLGNPALLEKVLLVLLPAVAAVGCYRAVRGWTSARVPAVLAGAAYALSASVLWSVSEGRIPELVFLAGAPWLATRMARGFDPRLRGGRFRWVIGSAAGLAIVGSFFPGAALAAALATLSWAIAGPRGSRRIRGLGLAALGLVGAGVLVFPVALEWVRSGSSLGDVADTLVFTRLLRLAPGVGPGTWVPAVFLPGAAALAFVFVSGPLRGVARPAALAALLGTYLAWAAATGRLPVVVSNPVAYLGLAGFAEALVVGAGLATLAREVSTTSFGYRQLGGALLGAVVGIGLVLQALQAAGGNWTIGGVDAVSPAEAFVAGPAGAPYRILWIGRLHGGRFPAPGGLPDGTVAAGAASVRWGLTGPAGASALDVGRPSAGPGYSALESTLQQILAGPVHQGGALLAPFGIRYVVASPRDLPRAAERRLLGQADLDLLSAGGLVIFQDAVRVPPAASIRDPAWAAAAFGGNATSVAALRTPAAVALAGGGGRYTAAGAGPPGPSLVYLAQQYDGRWRLRPAGGGAGVAPRRAFGWAVGFPAASSERGGYVLALTGGWVRPLELAVLGLLWLATLWITRRRIRRV